MHYVYVLKSGDKLYIGRTSDLKTRIKSHYEGINRSTKGHQWELIYYEAYKSLKDAIKRENQLKKHGNAKRWLKERIIHSLKGDI